MPQSSGHYKFASLSSGVIYSIINIQLQEFNERLDEVNTDLLLCMACISLNDSFLAFDKNRLIQFAKYYPEDFSDIELMVLDDQLQTYIMDVRVSKQFVRLKNIGYLAQKMVETKKKGYLYKCPPMLCCCCNLHPNVLKLSFLPPKVLKIYRFAPSVTVCKKID